MILFDRHAGFVFIAREERRGIFKNLLQEIWEVGEFKPEGMPKAFGFSKPDNPYSEGSRYLQAQHRIPPQHPSPRSLVPGSAEQPDPWFVLCWRRAEQGSHAGAGAAQPLLDPLQHVLIAAQI